MSLTRKPDINKLTLSAVMISLSAALSMVKVLEMPLGGSVTLLSMLPVCMLSIMYGCKHGLFCAFLFALSQLAVNIGQLAGWGLTPAALAGCIVFDYLAAFTVLGFSGLFRKKGTPGCISGIALAASMRLASHVISGSIFFAVFVPEGWNALGYSLCYNLAYMLPEFIFTAAGAVLLLRNKHTSKLFRIISTTQE
ncbi:MAG: energy-coupled thiamine transporter ThiT [Oscillospiraceae bacterium]|nr:energy-coupled thiamine transporter ThiT [Oscillospiraceae bacterium]